MNAICPCCGVHRLTPKPPRIDEVPWGDCACSDRVTCLAHQIDITDAPSRPTDAMLADKGQAIYLRRLKDHAETVERFASFDRAALQSQLDEALTECDRLRRLLADAKDEARERSEFANAETEHANRWARRARKAEALAEVERLRKLVDQCEEAFEAILRSNHERSHAAAKEMLAIIEETK